MLTIGALAVLVFVVAYTTPLKLGSLCENWSFSSSEGSGTCSRNGGDLIKLRTVFLFGGLITGAVGLGRLGELKLESALQRRDYHALRGPGYVDLNLTVTSVDGQRRVNLTTPTGKTAAAAFEFDGLSDRGADHLAALLKKRHRRRLGTAQARAVESLGSDLFDALFPARLETLYRETFDQVRTHDQSLRLVLRLDDTTADLPWEYLHDPKRATFLALSEETSVVRRLDTNAATRPQSRVSTVRILAMSAGPNELPPLDVDADLSELQKALDPATIGGSADLRIMEGGSYDDLRRAIDDFKPHIFYFVGHGAWDRELDDGVVMFESPQRRPHRVTGRELGVVLNRSGLRLAIFNSCEAARSSQEDRFAGVATSLVAQGVPAAIGMQFRVEDRAAATFGSTFLAELVTSKSIDDALTAARAAIFALPNEIEWGTPVLTTRLPVDDVLPRT